MIGRNFPTLALGALIVGVTAGMLGLLFDNEGDLTRAGILIVLAAIPPFTIWQSQRAHRNSADQLADAHEAGYRLALEHVARGLLDQHTAPPDDGERILHDNDGTADRSNRAGLTLAPFPGQCEHVDERPASNVRELHPHSKPSDLTERNAL
ncbi:hypothetical protein ACNYS0_20025 [Streptomyces sp. BH034]|uniref:hypothetical protein n=1 Tax=Streptomyces sp. BH034 TaxID=3402626 RepID=UPI003BB55D83